MGEFLAMSGVSKASRREVLECLEQFATKHGGRIAPAPGGKPFDHLILAGQDFGPITVLYPGDFHEWEAASAFLSETLGVPVISLHIHDGDLWMYVLYQNGLEVDQFNPIPDYWSEETSDDERAAWAGNANVLAENWEGVDPESVVNYLVTWDLDSDTDRKAYDTDEHAIGDCWQLLDFMARLGLPFPIDNQGEPLGEAYEFEA